MRKSIWLSATMLTGLLVACGTPPTPTAVPKPDPTPTPIVLGGYRPPQFGDTIEGATIAYQYVLPSLDKPVVVLAFGANLLQLVTVRPELSAGLVAYIRELSADKPVLAFDETNPSQTEPQSLKWDATQPVEIIFIPLTTGKHNWSVAETYQNEVQAAYKIVRRKDGGLRFIDAYGIPALQSANTLLPGYQGGVGLMLSARLALLRAILTNEKYQRGENVMESNPPTTEQYDARILKINPNAVGLAQNEEWVLSARPSPGGGMTGP